MNRDAVAAAPAPEVLALLDDSLCGGSRLYTGFEHEHRCVDPATLELTWQVVREDQARGLHAVLLADYEWGARLQAAGTARLRDDDGACLRVLMFRDLRQLDSAQTENWLREQDGGSEVPGPAITLGLSPSVTADEFTQAIDAIHAAIARGETYQVNHTFRLTGQLLGSPLSLFRRLRARQAVAFGAYIVLPPGPGAQVPTHVLSLSPELFLRHQDGVLSAKPMKGTAARTGDAEVDQRTAQALQQDPKNRAENLMIVDLLRNDLGRVAHTGSVKVPALFEVECYATVLQMTSTIEAQVRPEVDLPALLRASFPCGSITGAPKQHTMDLISGLESTPRGLYCGALGWIDAVPPGSDRALGDLCLSVPIRTLTLGPADVCSGQRALRLGVGAGIVWDSQADQEWAECEWKSRFLTDIDPGLTLFETLHALPGHLPRLERRAQHLARLARSAQAFGWPLSASAANQVLDELMQALVQAPPSPLGWRVRLDLDWRGRLSLRHAPLTPLRVAPDGTVLLLLNPTPLPAANPLSAHKTSWRGPYDAAIAQAEAQGAFDMIFTTQHGLLAEGARSNVLLRLEGQWWTPPVADGALPGIARAHLLASGWQGLAVLERSLKLADLARAEAVAVCNALRGVLPARWVPAN